MEQSKRSRPRHFWRSAIVATKKFVNEYKRTLRVMPNSLATLLWLVMLLYFTSWYLTQPRASPNNTIPKPCHTFSLWPYISCIGQHEELVFRGVCISMAVLISLSFILLCHLSAPIQPGLWLRRISTGFALVSSVALVALTYQLIDESPRPHLITTSGQIFTMFICKCFDWASNLIVRRAFRQRWGSSRRVRPLEVSRWLKIAVATWTIGPAAFTSLGIYGCQDATVIADQGSMCNKLVAVSEISEWELSIGWVAYMCTIAYDLYHIDDVVQIWKSVDDDNFMRNLDGDKVAERTGENGKIIQVQTLVPSESTESGVYGERHIFAADIC